MDASMLTIKVNMVIRKLVRRFLGFDQHVLFRRKIPLGALLILGLMSLSLVGCAAAGEDSLTAPSAEEPAAPTEGFPGEAPGEPPLAATGTIPLPQPTALPAPAEPTAVPLFPEDRLITLEWPSGIRVGDSDVVSLRLEPDESGTITPTAYFGDHEVQAEPVRIENLYDTHTIRAEARLEMLGLEMTPTGTTDRRLLPGEPVEFSWTLRPESPGTYRGTVWLMVRYLPLDGGEPLEKMLFSRPLEIEGLNLLGLGGQAARLLGLIGTGITSLFGLDDILTWIRRIRQRRTADA
jgi:hypothetical protein